MNKQGKGKIDYLDWTWNCVKGLCKQGCDYCYMIRFYDRFKLDKRIRFDMKELNTTFPKDPCRIGVCFNHDLFGGWIDPSWIYKIIKKVEQNPKHTFVFLTKNPKRYNNFKFPKNCWLGTTVDGTIKTINNLRDIHLVEHNLIKFVSFEPILEMKLLSQIPIINFEDLDWMIVGPDSNDNAVKVPLIFCDIFKKISRKFNVPLWIKDGFLKQGYPYKIKEIPMG